MKIDRLLSIILLLLNRDKVTAPELAGYFETSIRTIYRDIDTLSLAGIPIVSQQGTGGGYSLLPNFKLDRQFFTPEELLALMSGLKGYESAFKDRVVSSAVEKVQALVPQTTAVKKAVEIDFTGWDGEPGRKEAMSLLYKAVLSRQRVRFEYTNLRNETTQRSVEPIRLIFKGAAWYLFGFCLLKNDYRFFRLSRIHRPLLLDESFPAHDLSRVDLSGHMEWHTSPLVELHLRFPEEARGRLFEKFSEETMIHNTTDRTLEIRVTFPLDEWVYSLLLGLADVVEILSPAFVRVELLKRTEKFLKNNSKLTH